MKTNSEKMAEHLRKSLDDLSWDYYEYNNVYTMKFHLPAGEQVLYTMRIDDEKNGIIAVVRLLQEIHFDDLPSIELIAENRNAKHLHADHFRISRDRELYYYDEISVGDSDSERLQDSICSPLYELYRISETVMDVCRGYLKYYHLKSVQNSESLPDIDWDAIETPDYDDVFGDVDWDARYAGVLEQDTHDRYEGYGEQPEPRNIFFRNDWEEEFMNLLCILSVNKYPSVTALDSFPNRLPDADSMEGSYIFAIGMVHSIPTLQRYLKKRLRSISLQSSEEMRYLYLFIRCCNELIFRNPEVFILPDADKIRVILETYWTYACYLQAFESKAEQEIDDYKLRYAELHSYVVNDFRSSRLKEFLLLFIQYECEMAVKAAWDESTERQKSTRYQMYLERIPVPEIMRSVYQQKSFSLNYKEHDLN